MEYLVKERPKTTLKRNLPRTTSVSLKKLKIEYIFTRLSNGDIYSLREMITHLISSKMTACNLFKLATTTQL